jgi:hypothetical protein
MTLKRILLLMAVLLVLGTLAYLQIRTWSSFDWKTFRRVTGGIDAFHIVCAIAIVYITYILRALRWQIFLRPVARTRLAQLIPPQYIGFAGLALLGRPGEFIRPYLIARRESLPVSSQLAVWTVERIFDIGAFAVLMAIDVFFFLGNVPLGSHIRSRLQIGGGVLIALVGFMGITAWGVWRNSSGVSGWIETRLGRISGRLARVLGQKIRAFGEGLNTIHDRSAFLQLIGVSLGIWGLIALSYLEVLHAYPLLQAPALHTMNISRVLLLIGASMIGSMLQLPAVGGGSQLATISVMSSPAIFGIPKEQAVSAGMMLWLVTFMTCVPVGFWFAHHARLSLRKLTADSQREQQQMPAQAPR